MERLKYAMRLRLAMTEPYAHKWPEALVAMKMSPHYIQSLLGALHTDINEISYYAGNDATNFDWYTGRTALSTVYTATEMFMTQDRSPHFEATYQFLDQRLDDLSKVQNTTQQVFGFSMHAVSSEFGYIYLSALSLT
ncbi:rpsU-divergently transcribed protein [Sphaeroforma arctica JP610]|uniref:Ubiquinone biosynthesis protein n=1 Tax=Sphaeroforma arctica JP610 TaxID=667725 RepID=A0A0L0FG57_9EUKA|nr:rpsU-divergently transcribed protein [Sphaeroforma arctica JP610]KNC75762.1 rpsU-divergently transcribed protein [Sphaeroforma arctica JP610]|eukprot:XP_014149664.1 rpsU-divergently transcribed protein [Sphaeroforma arctica JP610]